MEPINWKVWITLYSSMAIAIIAIIGYRIMVIVKGYRGLTSLENQQYIRM